MNFNAAEPWKLELLVGRDVGPTEKLFLTFDLDYKPPQKYLLFTEAENQATADAAEPFWKKMWMLKIPEIIVLGLGVDRTDPDLFFPGLAG